MVEELHQQQPELGPDRARGNGRCPMAIDALRRPYYAPYGSAAHFTMAIRIPSYQVVQYTRLASLARYSPTPASKMR